MAPLPSKRELAAYELSRLGELANLLAKLKSISYRYLGLRPLPEVTAFAELELHRIDHISFSLLKYDQYISSLLQNSNIHVKSNFN